MKGLSFVIAAVMVGLPACGGTSGSGGATRTVLVDYNHDQFATAVFGFGPTNVTVHPGDTIDFKQAWTGEPHTVTMGQIAQPLGNAMSPYFNGTKAVPQSEPDEVTAAAKDLPQFFGDKDLNQTAAQPCYLDKGPLPADGKPCPKVKTQPEFNGGQALYSSGMIPYSGNNGNHFKVRLASTTPQGNYFFFCLVHGAPMGGYLQVRPKSVAIPSQSDVNKRAKAFFDKVVKRLVQGNTDAKAGKSKVPGADIVSGGSPGDNAFPFATSLEYYPSTFHAKVGQKVTWATEGHTVSFNVPKYGPQVIVDKDGTVKFNPKAYDAVNAPKPPDSGGGNGNGPPPPPAVVDAGNYDGSKFLSSGAQDNELFSLTFTKAGTYKYACLIHPRMIGTLVVA